MDHTLLRMVRDQASERLRSETEPPWVWYRLMKLQEAIDQVIDDLDSPMPQTRAEVNLRLVDSTTKNDEA